MKNYIGECEPILLQIQQMLNERHRFPFRLLHGKISDQTIKLLSWNEWHALDLLSIKITKIKLLEYFILEIHRFKISIAEFEDEICILS